MEGTVLGFAAGAIAAWSPDDPGTLCSHVGLPDLGREELLSDCAERAAGFDGRSVEFAIPLEDIGPVEAGDRVVFSLVRTGGAQRELVFPATGPGLAVVPDISNVEVFLSIDDPLGDDHGPGGYTYPTDDVFVPGSYDLVRFEAGVEGDDLVFTFVVDAVVGNPWGSASGLSIQTFDVYVDSDPGSATGPACCSTAATRPFRREPVGNTASPSRAGSRRCTSPTPMGRRRRPRPRSAWPSSVIAGR